MTSTGSTSSTNDVPFAIALVYKMFLKYGGNVLEKSADGHCEEIVISGHMDGIDVSMKAVVDYRNGITSCKMHHTRAYQPTYTLGSNSPVDYVPGRTHTTWKM